MAKVGPVILLLFSVTVYYTVNGDCGPEKLENCAKPLMAWSEDGLAIPKTEDEVVTNCK